MTTVSFWEAVPVIMALLGALLAWQTLTEADKDRDVVKDEGGARLATANKNVRIERIILSVQVAIFFIGLWTWFIPPPPYLPDGIVDPHFRMPPEELTFIIKGNRQAVLAKQIVMTYASATLVWLSYRNRRDLNVVRQRRASDNPVQTHDRDQPR